MGSIPSTDLEKYAEEQTKKEQDVPQTDESPKPTPAPLPTKKEE